MGCKVKQGRRERLAAIRLSTEFAGRTTAASFSRAALRSALAAFSAAFFAAFLSCFASRSLCEKVTPNEIDHEIQRKKTSTAPTPRSPPCSLRGAAKTLPTCRAAARRASSARSAAADAAAARAALKKGKKADQVRGGVRITKADTEQAAA